MIAVHYQKPTTGKGVVAYESNDSGVILCCNLQPSDMSRVVGISVSDENLQIGDVLYKNTIFLATRRPALIAEALLYQTNL